MQIYRKDTSRPISLKFTESIALLLKAKAVVGTGSNPLDELEAIFRAELRPDVAKAIFDAIDQGIEAIGKMATDKIEHIQQSLQSQVNEKETELQEVEKELNRQQQISQQELEKRQTAIDRDNKKRAELETELKNLREAVTKAQKANNQNQAEIEALKREEEETKRKFNEKIRQTEEEYRKRELEERRKQKELENKLQRLEAQKEASFGDKLRSQAEADRSWKWWLSKFGLFNANFHNFGSLLNV
jgi:DNA repair exonuclease SbcCD ATPase subunit